MATMQSSCHSRWMQWWTRTNSKKLLLLLLWQALVSFSRYILKMFAVGAFTSDLYSTTFLLLLILSPFLIWLADAKFGRYRLVMFGSLMVFGSSVVFYLALLVSKDLLSLVFYSLAYVVSIIGTTCFSLAIVPFLTDQFVGATSDELSAVVQWHTWSVSFGEVLSRVILIFYVAPYFGDIGNTLIAIIYAVPLAVIIISDCLCQQWLDRAHKVTNPIKLIIQVLNYTRKHRYPERRSAFTYIDEEQPTRMDYGKEKFGGPFTEEEVEDVKTVLRLIPLVICISALAVMGKSVSFSKSHKGDFVLEIEMVACLFPVILIPLYRLILRRFIHRYTLSMLKSLGIGFFVYLLGKFLLDGFRIKAIVSDDLQKYLSCRNASVVYLDDYFAWYWSLGPYLIYGFGRTIVTVLPNVIIIAQSPDKMKGLVFGIYTSFDGVSEYFVKQMYRIVSTLCYDIPITVLAIVLFAIYIVFLKCYTLRERNREINIQAIVEEHYERYMDQEEEYMREQRNLHVY